jgi:hypothetical protein
MCSDEGFQTKLCMQMCKIVPVAVEKNVSPRLREVVLHPLLDYFEANK